MLHVRNVHSRDLPVPPETVGALLDSLASRDDRLWPYESWPRMRFDAPLEDGAAGGHGPIRYVVDSYAPGRAVTFRFTGPRGFHGTHGFTIEADASGSRLTHLLVMEAKGLASLSWPLVFRPLHDALLEDALHKAAAACGVKEPAPSWSAWVRALRAVLSPRRR